MNAIKKVITLLVFSFSMGSQAQNITIGSQVWMSKNLDVSRFRNGDTIPQAKTEEQWKKASEDKQPIWCYYADLVVQDKHEIVEDYGKLYNWYAVSDPRQLAPAGYHIPSDEEWHVLTEFVGGSSVAAKKMKSKNGWKNNGNGTNEIGFSALSGGMYSYFDPSFLGFGEIGCWWSSTVEDSVEKFSWYRTILDSENNVLRSYGYMGDGYSVRCLKD